MKAVVKITAVAIVTLFITAVTASAQIQAQYKAEIPFDFTAGSSNMKAGEYILGLANPGSTLPVLALMERESGKQRLISPVHRSQVGQDDEAKLTFVRSGDEYVLAAVKTSNYEVKMKKTHTGVKAITSLGADPEMIIVKLIKK